MGQNPQGEPRIIAAKYGDVTNQDQTTGAVQRLNSLNALLKAQYQRAQLATDENGKPLSDEMRQAYIRVEAEFGKVREALVPKLQQIHAGKLRVDPPPQLSP